MRKRNWLAAAGLAAALALSACSSSGSSSESSAPAESTAAVPSASAAASEAPASEAPAAEAWLTDAEAKVAEYSEIPTTIPSASLGDVAVKPGSKVFHVACNLALEGCSNLANAMQDAADAAGVDFTVCDGGTTADSILGCFTQGVNAKPDVIITNGIGTDIAGDGYAAAEAAGIPVIGTFTGNDPGVPGVATEVAGDTCTEQGNVLGDWVVVDSAGTAKTLFFGTQTYKCNQQRQAGFDAALAACPTCSLKDVEFAIDAIQTTLPQQISAELTTNPETTHIAGTFDAIAAAAADQVRQAGKTDITVAGFDANAPNLQLIAAGDLQEADITTGSVDAGWTAMDAALRVIAGQELPPVLPVSMVLITPDNIAEIGEVFKGATGYEEQFLKLWGISAS